MSDRSTSEYPTMARGTWWHLRRRFQKAMPRKVSREYLVSALISTEDSAPNSTMPDLRRTGLINDGGVPTDLARKWMDDAQYREACNVIRERLYPRQLDDIAADRTSVASWFVANAEANQKAAERMAAFYFMLAEADLTKLRPIALTPDG